MDLKDIKRHLNNTVLYKNSQYILTACILRKNRDGFYYQVELEDIHANSISICRLEDIQAHEQ